MSKRKKNQIKAGYMIAAALFLLMAWVSFRNYSKLEMGLSYSVSAEKAEAISSASLRAFLGGICWSLYGIMLFGIAFFKRRCQESRSTDYAKMRLDQVRAATDEETLKRLDGLAFDYMEHYFTRLGWSGMLYQTVLFAVCAVALSLSRGNAWAVLGIVVMAFLSNILFLFIKLSCFKQVLDLLARECRPFGMAIAFLMPIGTPQYVRVRAANYSYHSAISLSFYYMGEFEWALEHLDILREECFRKNKNSINKIHLHNLKLYCFRELLQNQNAAKEKKLIEDYLKLNPKFEKHVYVKNYRRQERILELMENGQLKEAAQMIKERSDAGNPLYLRVANHYQLWKIAKFKGDVEEAATHERFIAEYGKDMFYYARINSDRQ